MTAFNTESLKNRDYYLAIDRSGSMEEKDCPNGKSRWDYMQESVTAFAGRMQELDEDGITVIPFNSQITVYDNTTQEKVKDIFKSQSPGGGTALVPVLKWAFDDYFRKKNCGKCQANGALLVIVTDGLPSDESDAAQLIVGFTKKLESRAEFGISFIQIGKDPHASEYLTRLDTHLEKEGSKLDIVNTMTMDQVDKIGLQDALIAALTN